MLPLSDRLAPSNLSAFRLHNGSYISAMVIGILTILSASMVRPYGVYRCLASDVSSGNVHALFLWRRNPEDSLSDIRGLAILSSGRRIGRRMLLTHRKLGHAIGN